MEATQTRAAATEQSNPLQQAWWEAWLPGLLVAQAAGLVLIFFLTAYPDLGLLLVVLEAACAVALGFLLKWVRGLLGPATVVEVVHKPDGRSKLVRRHSMPQLALGIALATGALSAFNTALFVAPTRALDASISYIPALASISLACTGAFVVGWLGYRGVSLTRRLLGVRGLSGIVAIVAGVAYFTFALTPMSANSVILQGAPAPWSKIYALAQHEADRRASGSILSNVSVLLNPKWDGPYNPQAPWIVSFNFAGSGLWVSVLDCDPPRIWSEYGGGWGNYPSHPAETARLLATVKLGPRDVYRLTEQEAVQYGREVGISSAPNVGILLDSPAPYFDHPGGAGPEGRWGWQAIYQFQRGNDIDLDNVRFLELTLDPVTGAVLERDRDLPGGGRETCSPCSTPAPQLTPAPTATR